jgi:hypothetical protein
MRKKITELREQMFKQYPKLAENTVFTLNPCKTSYEGYRLLVNDVKRADIATM